MLFKAVFRLTAGRQRFNFEAYCLQSYTTKTSPGVVGKCLLTLTSSGLLGGGAGGGGSLHRVRKI